MWLSLVERHVRDVEAAGSNPVTSTIKTKRGLYAPLLFLLLNVPMKNREAAGFSYFALIKVAHLSKCERKIV